MNGGWKCPSLPVEVSGTALFGLQLQDGGTESKHTCHALPSLQLIIHNQHLNIPPRPVRKHRPPEQNRLSNVRPGHNTRKTFSNGEGRNVAARPE